MSVVISLSKLLRLGLWLAATCVVIGVALGDHGTSQVGSTPDTVTSTTTAVEPVAGDGR
jgi:hypothetical protein